MIAASAPRSDWDLVVVGGGWAGCSAAHAGAARGWRTLLVEAGAKLGGRASSFQDPVFGEMDNGQHLFLGAYTRSLALLAELGTAQAVAFQSPLRIPYLMADGRVETLQASALPGPLSLGLGLLRHGALGGEEKTQLLALGLPWKAGPRLGAALMGLGTPGSAKLSVAGWLRACGQGQALMDQVWEPMVLAALNARPQQARLTEFLAVLGQGFLRGGRTAALGRSTLPLSQLLAPLEPWLQHRGGQLRLSTALRHLRQEGAAWQLDLGPEGGAVASTRVVLALPPERSARALGPHPGRDLGLDAEAARPRSAIVSVTTLSVQPLLPHPMVAFGPQGPGVQPHFHWGFSEPMAAGWRTCFVASAADALSDLEGAELLKRLAGFLAGRGRPYQWDHARVLRERHATPRFVPGSGPRLPQRTALPGLALAGDWTDTGLPATIEGAVRSGEKAIAALAQGKPLAALVH
jgi:squalene-associated FAD-dependent desaturase